MKNKIALESLCMDLKRIALAYYSNSDKTAEIFTKEALKRTKEIDRRRTKKYFKTHLNNISKILSMNKSPLKTAEHALMYSTIVKNYLTSQNLGKR